MSIPPGSTPPDELERGLAFERLVFFSDAVFAIAITLLIIEVRLPALPDGATSDELLAALRQIAPEVFVYVLSFWTIGLYWLAHWRRFRFIARVDERLVALNLVLLALIAFIPFPTAVIGEHGDLVPAVVLYALALSAAGVAGPITWVYAWRNGLTVPGIEPGYARLAALRGFSVPLVMLGTMPLLLVVGTQVVELLWFLIIPVQIAMNRLVDAKGSPAP